MAGFSVMATMLSMDDTVTSGKITCWGGRGGTYWQYGIRYFNENYVNPIDVYWGNNTTTAEGLTQLRIAHGAINELLPTWLVIA